MQNDLVKSAKAAGVPVVLGVASWDHLTTKGLVRVPVDQALVWNQHQADEAEQLHGLARERDDRLTGAQPFDRWFEQRARSREVICEKAGLSGDKPFLVFLGSTQSISNPRPSVISSFGGSGAARERRARGARRGGPDPPHPYNAELWSEHRRQ